MSEQLEPRAEGIMRMARILAWISTDPSQEIDTVWRWQTERARRDWAIQAALILQTWNK